MNFSIVRNTRNSKYEIHAAGCAHLAMGRRNLESMGTVTAANAADAAADFEAGNEDCFAHVSPCAKKAGV